MRIETAWLEAQQGFAFKAQPMTLCGYDVDCADLADLTDPGACAALGITPEDLSCPWEFLVAMGLVPPSWTVADRLLASGHSGIQVRSFAPGATGRDINVVFWDWARIPPHQVRIIDDERRLPRNDLSWEA
jgi:RES domain-containing protein